MFNVLKKRGSYLKSGGRHGIGASDSDDAKGSGGIARSLANKSHGKMNAGLVDDARGGAAAAQSMRHGAPGLGAGSKGVGFSPGDDADEHSGNEDLFRGGFPGYAGVGGGADPVSSSGGATGGKTLSHSQLAHHHKALADHYDSLAGGSGNQSHGGLEPGLSADHLGGDENMFDLYKDQNPDGEGAVPESFEKGKNNHLPLHIGGEDLEDLTGQQESPAYEKSESPDEEAMEELGTNRASGGGLRNSKEQKPLSKFGGKGNGFGTKTKSKKRDSGF